MSPNHRSLRLGILGTAKIARTMLIQAIQAATNADVVAVASRSEDAAKRFGEKLDIPKAYGSYEALLADPDIDAVYIPLPNHLHRPWTEKAAAAKKHVLCEKPLGLDAAEAQAMADACEEHGVYLMEAFMYRFHPRHERIRELLAHGRIGTPRLVKATFSFNLAEPDANIRTVPEYGGGGLMDVGCYCINISRYIFETEPIRVYASGRIHPEFGVDTLLAGILDFGDGRQALIDCGMELDAGQHYEIIGTEGHLVAPKAFRPGFGAVPIRTTQGDTTVVEQCSPGVNQFQRMVEHFADAVLHGLPLRFPASDAVANMRVIDALAQSLREGRPVDLP